MDEENALLETLEKTGEIQDNIIVKEELQASDV